MPFPRQYKTDKSGYIDLVINGMLPIIAKENLADFIDVFCEQGFFTQSETERICFAGKEHGLIPKIHANQLYNSGGVQAGVHTGALSVDHLETIGDDEISLLADARLTLSHIVADCSILSQNELSAGQKINRIECRCCTGI
jgi:imidazolonepropionase